MGEGGRHREEEREGGNIVRDGEGGMQYTEKQREKEGRKERK